METKTYQELNINYHSNYNPKQVKKVLFDLCGDTTDFHIFDKDNMEDGKCDFWGLI